MTPGAGHTGFCKICAHPEAARFIKGAREGGRKGTGWNAAEAMEMGKIVIPPLEINRKTWYRHLEHARTGEQRLIQAAEKVRETGALTVADIKRSSNTEVLEAIRDLGMKRALENPDAVTVDQSLKAIQIMESRKDKQGDSLNILVQFVTGQPPAVVVEGTAREIPDGDPS